MKLSLIQKEKKGVLELLRKFPLRPDNRLRIYALVQRFFWRMKYSRPEYNELIRNQSFAPSNLYYGHEYWLKKYSGYNDKIYAHIEHGVYFGENPTKVAGEEEWELGSIITYGESRLKLLKKLYPDYNIFLIGPRIHYAETDKDYYKELYEKIDHTGKVLTLYPTHSLASTKSLYDSKLFLEQAEALAEKIGAKTIMVSLHPSDLLHQLDIGFSGKKVVIVGGGKDSIKFLPRLRAILELSDLTFSNGLGTNLGYSLYMGTPQVMNLDSNHNVDPNVYFEEEQKKFASVFNGGDNPLVITEEQKRLCDYYFGITHIKTPAELFHCLAACKEKYEERFKRH